MKIKQLGSYAGALLLISIFSGGAWAEEEPDYAKTPPPNVPLTRGAAATRAKQVEKVSYGLWFGLDEDKLTFNGRTKINFTLKQGAAKASKDLFIDLDSARIMNLTVNDKIVPKEVILDSYDGNRLKLAVSELKTGQNRVEISYSRHYSTGQTGLMRYKDPLDGKVYVYSDLEPFNAHEVFPCFDQPDLKATYELTVEVPPDWTVISNTLERDTPKLEGRKSWQFPPTPAFSTYVFGLNAGPFHSWTYKGATAGEGTGISIPMRLFARKSIAKYVDYQEWFKISKAGMDLFSAEFAYPFPFSKYDHVILPDLASIAMENVAASSFTEGYVYRTRVSDETKSNRRDTILHELAHMWFGNLVTMRWWNGLWLNESFATLMAAWAAEKTQKGTKGLQVWESFYLSMKRWAYQEDGWSTAHSVDVPVPDTDYAFANFDGITYGKGAALLKQLMFVVDEDDFFEGLQRYFQTYAYHNTTLADFMKKLGEASGQDLAEWQNQWLKTTGTNTVEAEWTCKKDEEDNGEMVVSEFKLKQSPSPLNTVLRTHRTQVAFYYEPDFKPKHVTKVTYSGAETPVPDLVGEPCPSLVFPNHHDMDYVKVKLDPKSFEAAKTHLAKLNDSLDRLMIWSTIWDQVLDGTMPPQQFADLAIQHLEKEKDGIILNQVLTQLGSQHAGEPTVLRYLNGDQREKYWKKIEALALKGLQTAPAWSNQQLVWFESFLQLAKTPASSDFLKGLLAKKASINSFRIDQPKRWEILQTLARIGGTEMQPLKDLIAAELKRDSSDVGIKQAIRASAMLPDADSKAQWLDLVVQKKSALDVSNPIAKYVPKAMLSVAQLTEAMETLQVLGQEDYIKKTADAYFEVLAKSKEEEAGSYLTSLAGALFPAACDSAVIDRAKSFLSSHSDLQVSVGRLLRDSIEEDQRCIKIRQNN